MKDVDSGPTTHPSLLARLRDVGDAEAWKAFAEVYTPLIYSFCRRQRLQEADAADVCQDVLAQLTRSLATFAYQPERGRFRDWLGAVVRSKILRCRQRQARAGTGGAADGLWDGLAAPAADTEWTAAFNAHVVRVALDRIRSEFQDHNWQAFERTWLQGGSAAEVARELKMSPTAVYVSKWRVLQRLREEVLALAEDLPVIAPAGGTERQES